MKIALIQFAPVFGDLKSNIERLKPLLVKAKNADLLVLPELANSGYNFGSIEEAKQFSETIEDSIFINFLKKYCREFQFCVATGFLEREDRKLFNSALLIDQTGVIGKYRKLHLFMKEKEYFAPGNLGLPIFTIGDVKIGMLICFDWMFPEVWRRLALKDVDLILHPSNLILPYAQSVIPSYSLVNRIFIATANRVGTEEDLRFTGQSVITNPKGELIAQAGTEEEIVILDIDPKLARDKMITPMNDAFKDRRRDIYK
ncbi:nitrilase-related carbon-nitrogen hydrolase [Marinifilum sp. RC60d5]|uniref:nitrilase-related carbon-nitrogen hydrolase n=1 Tax=Marinifilum sp. RC60d5 TaxID=3458414 RepID=UPI004035FA3D